MCYVNVFKKIYKTVYALREYIHVINFLCGEPAFFHDNIFFAFLCVTLHYVLCYVSRCVIIFFPSESVSSNKNIKLKVWLDTLYFIISYYKSSRILGNGKIALCT